MTKSRPASSRCLSNGAANSRGLSQNVVLLSLLMVFGLALFPGRASIAGETIGEYIDDSTITTQVNAAIVKDPDAHYLKIDVSTTQGDVVLTGFVNSRETEERLVTKIREIRGVKAVKSLLKVEGKN
jgi:hyperosmotically inducible periplasmic protein